MKATAPGFPDHVMNDSDVDTARQVLVDAISELEHVSKAVVVLTGLGASSVDFHLRCWAPNGEYWGVKDAMTRAAKYARDGASSGIPYQTMDVNLLKQDESRSASWRQMTRTRQNPTLIRPN